MRKAPRYVCVLLIMILGLSTVAAKSYDSWSAIAEDMSKHLQKAARLYADGDGDGAKDAINVAYFKYYEKLGFEKTVMSYISGKRGAAVESRFNDAKHIIIGNRPASELTALLDEIILMLREDAAVLDGDSPTDDSASGSGSGSKSGAFITFMASFTMTMREGLEAVLVIVAIIAYLVRTRNKKHIKKVYAGALLGILFSILLALVFNLVAAKLGEARSGIGQEIFEGIAMFLAVIVLFWVSNWMISKAEVDVWNQYIKNKVEQSVTRGSAFALVFTAFLAVAREGAELILFFQGLRSNASNNPLHLWLGLGVAILLLAVIYVAIRFYSMRLPLKPFFYATSILMYILCFSFMGKGVFELQEADVIGRTFIPWMGDFSFDLLGIYNRYETLIPQIVLLIITVVTIVWHVRKSRRVLAELQQNAAVEQENL